MERKQQFVYFLLELIETFKSFHSHEIQIVAELTQVEVKVKATKLEINRIQKAVQVYKGLKLIDGSLSDCKKLMLKNTEIDLPKIDFLIAKIEVP